MKAQWATGPGPEEAGPWLAGLMWLVATELSWNGRPTDRAGKCSDRAGKCADRAGKCAEVRGSSVGAADRTLQLSG